MFGQVIRDARIARGWTQQRLAQDAGVSVRTVRNIENGRQSRSAAPLARVLGVEPPTEQPVVQVRVLGPLQVLRAGHPFPLTAAKQRLLLALLALQPGTTVGRDEIADVLWGPEPPASWPNLVQTYVTRLRRALADGPAIITDGPGYQLVADHRQLDVHAFHRHADAGELAAALDCWRGLVLADEPGLRQHPAAVALQQRRLTVALRYADTGATSGVLDRLAAIAAVEPLHEGLQARYVRALADAGRQADAVTAFQRVRDRLDTELGLYPGAELKAALDAVLRPGDDTPPPAPVPAQLPADIAAFTGRIGHLALLDAVAVDAERACTIGIALVSGVAGVGKSALAVHWAHRVRDRFPDGQLYVNLRGFDPACPPTTPAEVVRGFLEALSVAPRSLPDDLDAQLGLYRSLLAGRRMLVVFDNARDSAQIRPLLPGAPGSLVLVTSRNELTGLVAGHGARPVNLGLLSTGEATGLLARRLGAGRLAAEPAAAAEIVAHCARLPLALTMVAALGTLRPDTPLAALAADLRDSRARLDTLTGDDEASDVRAVFSWSYRGLSSAAARLFRLLGVHPGPDLTAPAAASLAGAGLTTVRVLLTELARSGLVVEHLPGRFTCHDLLRAYAREQCHDGPTDEDRPAAARRMLDHYLHTALAADALLAQHRNTVPPPPIEPGTAVEPLADRRAAGAWFGAERQVLVRAVEYAVTDDLDTRAWHLAWALATYFHRQGHGRDWVATQHAAMAAAVRLGDMELQVRTHNDLAGGYLSLGRADEAEQHLRRALKLFESLGDHTGEAGCHLNLALVLTGLGRHREALDHDRRGLALFRRTGSLFGQASALNAIGWELAHLGDLKTALDHCEQALALHQRIGPSSGLADVWDSLGLVHRGLGHPDEALSCYEKAARAAGEVGTRYKQATAMVSLGDVCQEVGKTGRARSAWRHALAILEDLDHPEAEQVRERLVSRRPR
jgi:DNA-binding SARP family transcriptional activator/tetratricopeptide (TPR) repeat protein/DNA-binding XRE family transcriptional regulator